MRVAIYARVSTERQEKEQTIDSQIEQLEQYAKENKHIIVQKYIDERWSGELLARPALDQLRDDCGSRYTGIPCHGKLYYRCTNRQRCFPLHKECNARTIKASIIESVVWDSICEAIKNPKLLITQIKELRKKRC